MPKILLDARAFKGSDGHPVLSQLNSVRACNLLRLRGHRLAEGTMRHTGHA